MSMDNVLASVAVKDIKAASEWYSRLFERAGSTRMPAVAEWSFPRGGCLRTYQKFCVKDRWVNRSLIAQLG